MAVVRSEEKDDIALDANKSPLTHKVVSLASAYLALIGCKPIETEVSVAPRWVADLASFTYPTRTELRYGKLLKNVFEDNALPSSDEDRYAKLMGRVGLPLTALVEVKVTKSDFVKDIERKFCSGAAHLNYVAYPKLLEETVTSVSDQYFYWHWGRIVTSDTGDKVLKVYPPRDLRAMHPGDVVDFIANVAIRRDHRTSKVFFRDMLKSFRAKRAIRYCVRCKGELGK